jgi:capsular exopolysaccharide synthesis family protein
VILVDADLHQPKQMQLFGLSNTRGLTTYLLDGSRPVAALLQPTASSHLRVLTAGPIADEPPSLLSSTRLETLLAELRSDCDVLVIDTPPVLAQADAALISPYCDGVLFVIDATRTRGRQAERALGQLRYSGAALLGAILNRAPKNLLHPAPYRYRSSVEDGTPTNGRAPAAVGLSDVVVPTKDAGSAG